MKEIKLNGVIPEIFTDRNNIDSEVWHNDICFERGRSYLIEAASGTGKSSLCSYLYGQRGDYRGTILFDNDNITSYDIETWCRVRRSSISILFQDLRLFGELTAMENIEIKNRMTNHRTRTEIDGWFEELGIADKRNTPINRISYGQQQRVALIRALCQPFDFLLLDEPISHLDEQNSDIMRNIILRETAKNGAAVIATSIGKSMNINYDKRLKL